MNIIFRRDGDDEVTDLRVVQIHVGEGPQHMLREQGISALKTLAYLDYAPWDAQLFPDIVPKPKDAYNAAER